MLAQLDALKFTAAFAELILAGLQTPMKAAALRSSTLDYQLWIGRISSSQLR
ncbi:hypothetical protein [Mycolicibacterium sp. P1-5]|uniref:hypothetical protein n=1 Tax=Mycolicibacterium sp. P1-5 TaxID=2024617 RepID=UPI00188330CC|nr:hypothetical protein [Mycolicibacterium sp. P1-5]